MERGRGRERGRERRKREWGRKIGGGSKGGERCEGKILNYQVLDIVKLEDGHQSF